MDFDDQPSAPGGNRRARHGRDLVARPVPWLGSATIGRWLNFLTTGIAEMSSVLRV
jgi:hypothetical protein